MSILLWLQKVRDVKTPKRANPTDSWIDLYIPNDIRDLYNAENCVYTPKNYITDEEQKELKKKYFDISTWKIIIPAWYWLLIPSWLRMVLLKEEDWELREVWLDNNETIDIVAHNKSWVATKKNLIVWAQVIDEPYRWEVHIHLINSSKFDVEIEVWEKIIQVIVRKLIACNTKELTEDEYKKFENTSRGSGWFGSTWTK